MNKLLSALAILGLTVGMSGYAMAGASDQGCQSSGNTPPSCEEPVVNPEPSTPNASDGNGQLVKNSDVVGVVNVGGALFGGNAVGDDLRVNNTVVGNNMNLDGASATGNRQVVKNSDVTGLTNVGGVGVGGNYVDDNVSVNATVVGNNLNSATNFTVDNRQVVNNSDVTSMVNVGGVGLAGNLVGDNMNVNNTTVGNNINVE